MERKECSFIKWKNTSFGTPEALPKRLRIKSALELGKATLLWQEHATSSSILLHERKVMSFCLK